MSFFGDLRHTPATPKPPGTRAAASLVIGDDPSVPLLNLSTVQSRMDSLQKFLSDSVNSNTLLSQHQMNMVSDEITSAIHQIIANGAALLAASQSSIPPSPEVKVKANPKSNHKRSFSEFDRKVTEPKVEVIDEAGSEDWEIIELDAVELLAEHLHFCDICGKGFKRDANLRMHMRAHGDQFKTPEALAKPGEIVGSVSGKKTRFSCPFSGCARNKTHRKFRPLKSAICVKNHFKRSHCPKMYSCSRCNKKSFSVPADLRSHLKHCGEAKWKCSCGTSFSRKDKLFGHVALFEGHMPAIEAEEEGKSLTTAANMDEDLDLEMDMDMGVGSESDIGFLDRLMLDGFESIDNYCFQDVLGCSSPNVSASAIPQNIEWFS